MARQNDDDVRLTLEVQTTGTEQVTALRKQVEALAQEGGAAAPQFQKLADELRRIEEQSQVVQTFRSLQDQITQTGTALAAAQKQSREFNDALRDQSAGVSELREKQAAATATIQEQKARLVELRAELNTLKKDSDSATKSTEAYKQQVLDLNRQISPLENSLAKQGVALRDIKNEMSGAEAVMKKTATAYKSTSSEVSRLEQKLTDQNAALGETKTQMTALGLSTESLAAAERQVVTNTEQVVAALRKESAAYQDDKAAIEALAQATERLAAEQTSETELLRLQADMQAHAAAESEKLAQAKRDEAEAQKQAAAATQQALQDAYGKVGLGSVQKLEQELREVREAMNLIQSQSGLTGKALAQAMDMGNRRVKDLELSLRRARNELTMMDRAKDLFKSMGAQVGFGVTAVQGLTEAVMRLGRSFWEANTGLEQWRRGFLAVYKDSGLASQQLDVLRTVANDAGVEISELAPAFVKFSASAKDAGVPVATINGLFAAVTKNAAMLGQSGADVNRMLTALGQMASKGTVQMEELKQQLGDALPGALPKLARALGLTQGELMKLVETGGLLAKDAFPALQKVLEETAGTTNTMTASAERFKNMFAGITQDIGDTGVWDALKVSLNAVGALVGGLGYMIQLAFDAAVTHVKALVVLITGFTRGEFKLALEETERLTDEFLGRQSKRLNSLNAYLSNGIGKDLGLVSDSFNSAGASADASAEKMSAFGAELAALEKSTNGTNQSLYRMVVDFRQANDELERGVRASRLLVEAKKIEGRNLERIATLSGSEAAQRNAATLAAENNAAALSNEAAATESLLKHQQAYVEALTARLKAEGDANAEADARVIKAKNSIVVLEAEIAKTREAAQAARLEAEAKKVAAQTYLDNSANLEQYRQNAESAARSVEDLTRMITAGLIPQEEMGSALEELNTAQRIAAESQALYRDAINDTVAAAERQKNGAQQFIQIAGESKFALEYAAQATANYAQQLDLTAQASEREAAAIRRSMEALQAEIDLYGDPEGKIAAQIASLDALAVMKDAEAEKSRQSTQAARDEADARQLAADTYKDNSDKLMQYAAAARQAEAELKKVIVSHAQGRASTDDVAEATRKAAQAQAMYKDALNDTNTKLQAQIALQQALSNERTAGLKLELEQARTAEQIAKARGDENAAIQAQIRQKQIEKQIRAESARTMRDEADAIIAAAEAEMREARASGTLTPIKEQEIQARIANARAKKLEANATDETLRQINAEIGATRNLINTKNELQNTNTGTNGSGETNSSSSGASSGTGSRYSKYGSNGSWRNDDGSLNQSGRNAARGVNRSAMDELKQKKDLGLLSESDLDLAEKALMAADYNNKMMQNLGAGWAALGARDSAQGKYREAKKMYDDIKAMSDKKTKDSSTTQASTTATTRQYQQDLGTTSAASTTTAAATQPAQTTTEASHHYVTVNIGGGDVTVGTASEADSQRLEQLIQQIANAARRSYTG